jgi:hypothetical protein
MHAHVRIPNNCGVVRYLVCGVYRKNRVMSVNHLNRDVPRNHIGPYSNGNDVYASNLMTEVCIDTLSIEPMESWKVQLRFL